MKPSDRIKLLSFILTFLVIWVHAVNAEPAAALSGPSAPWTLYMCGYLQDLLGSSLGQAAVPGFFCISGYLFFRNARGLSAPKYLSFFLGKWYRRFFSLVIPYILWNTIYLIIYLLAGKARFTLCDIAEGIFLYAFNPVFWYMQQLIIITLLAPLAYLLIRKLRLAVISITAFFFLAAFYSLLPFHIVNEDALFYYAFGAAVSIYMGENIENAAGDMCRNAGFTGFFLLLAGGFAAECTDNAALVTGGTVLLRLGLVTVIYSFMGLICSGRFPAGLKGRFTAYLDYNFFIYATHYLFIRFYRVLSAFFMGGDSILYFSLGYLLMPVLCILTAVCTGRLMLKLTPGLYHVLTGRRG